MVNRLWEWFKVTALIVGMPVTVGLILVACERSFHTLTCETARFNCSRSLLHGVSYITEQVDSEHDVILTPEKPRKR
jgi:hypothetical protein